MANFVSTTFDNLDLYVLSSTKEEMDILSSTKEEMDARKGNFSFVTKNKKKELPKVFFIDLEVYRRKAEPQRKFTSNSSVIQVSLKGLVFFYAWHDVDACSLMHIRKFST